VVHVSVPGGTDWERSSDRPSDLWGLFVSENVSRRKTKNRHRMTEKSMCAARDDPAQRCREGTRRGRQGEEPGRLLCRPSAYRQGALPPMRTLVCSGVPPRSPGVLRTRECSVRGSTRVPLEYSRSWVRLSTPQHAGVPLVFHSIVECSSVHAAEVTTVAYLGTLEYPEYG
jgi:hypothetical protein